MGALRTLFPPARRAGIAIVLRVRVCISMWKEGTHSSDFKFFDRNIKEMFTVGGTGISVHKYLGILNQGPSTDASLPQTVEDDPLGIQDLLFLENRDRKYSDDI